ncbi:Serine protease [Candidatus Methanophagaceae archaeon]|nr:Serine protease [Methanophagales archaeon]
MYESTKGFSKSTENEIYNLAVFVDPENMVEESNEDNNEEKKMMDPDLTFVFPEITFLNKNGNAVSSDKLIARENHTIRVNVKNTGCVAATDFYVKLYVNKSDNTKSDEPVAGFPMSKKITRLEPGVTSEVDFSWTPPEAGFYRVKVMVDEKNEVPEINDKNNVFSVSDEVKAGELGYRAKDEPLRIGGKGMLNGGIIYDPYCKYVCPDPNTANSYDYSHVFDINLPQSAEVVLARLYMYVWSDKADPKHPGFRMGWLPEVELTFGDKVIPNPNIYADTTGASAENYTYATYCYDVTSAYDGTSGHAKAYFTRKEPMRFGVNGMALIVVYRDSNSVLTSYWIGEGSDVLMAKNMKFPTGFEFEECTRKCMFEGMADAQKANASLLTVLAPYTSYDATELLPEAGGKGDSLSFQGLGMQNLGILIGDTTGHWNSRHSITIAFTENEWEYVDVKDGPNIAEVQSRGNHLVLKHAILKAEYLPDLVPCIPRSVVVGLPMTVDIENQGQSKVGDFNVSFSVNGDPEKKMHVKELEGGSRVQLTLPWTTRAVGQLERLNISVDCDKDVRELSENNNNVSPLVAVADREIIPIFDTGSSDNPYPSISGIHKGTIRLNHTITVNKMYTYACAGTGGHTEYIEISNGSGIVAIGQWDGYTGDRHNISFYPSFRMLTNHTYNYTIITCSYPQIHHTSELKTKGGRGIFNCTSFVDANGRSYNNRIPAIRLEGNFVDDHLPDLEVNEIEAYYTNTDIRYLNLNNDVKVKITNNGSINTGPFEIKLVANAEDVDIKTIPVLEPNSSTYVVFNWTPIYNVTRPPINADHVSENYTLNVIVDQENRIIESNETNNMMAVNVSAIWNGRMGGNGVLGDPYITTLHQGKLHGGTIYTFGDSYKYWKYAVQPGNPYTVKYDVTLPPSAKVELANIYTYFEWFVTEQPKADVTFATPDGESHLSIEGWYWDRAYAFIFGPFLWGVLKYDVTPYINGNGTYNFSLKHSGGPKYFVDGALLFIVYRDESEPLIEYWVSEGADLIGGRDIEYLRYEDTTAKAEFTGGEIDIANVTNVTLFSVVNWGFQTDLWFNGHLLGKDCFTSIHPDQEEIAQYNVTMIPAEYLNSSYNLVEMEFRGNCRNMPANAVLVVEYKKEER